MTSTSWTHERARVARLSQTRPTDDPVLSDARRDLRAARAGVYIRKLVDAAPAPHGRAASASVGAAERRTGMSSAVVDRRTRRGASRRTPLVNTAAAKLQVVSESTGVIDIFGVVA